jgi:hypothetical protein
LVGGRGKGIGTSKRKNKEERKEEKERTVNTELGSPKIPTGCRVKMMQAVLLCVAERRCDESK